MQMCPECDKVYDESEYCRCPYCHDEDDGGTIHIVCDDEQGVLELTDDEYEEFKITHPEYR